ncbi:acyl-CoA dehydrogenase family protein [Marinicrinis sediminis]|uniref:Acyl-CoA dehydrogenase family protein n=1 Tax=Marinicrinis sediminis TaxID=1652465 RepID=A0ABW5REX4_9BACL
MARKWVQGGAFVMEQVDILQMVTPEDFTEEQLLIAQTTRDFIEKEVLPVDAQLEALDYPLTVSLLKKAGDTGLLSADIPESYGGLELDKVTSTLISEELARGSSLALSIGAHVGIGTLPIVFFGNEEQKAKYLPLLATGEKIAAYCLTEPSSGSDALSAKTTAALSEDGAHYVLNGSKLYITNAGFADLFIVYAKIDGKHFSAFIVEKGMPGFSMGPEEKKMGIKGSSTRPLYFEDVRIPAGQLLGEKGKGHVIAFNILNMGRFKLAAGCLGAAKESIELSADYAITRKQFGKALADFPLIQQKLAQMNTLAYVLESMVYRTSGAIDQRFREQPPVDGMETAQAIAEYAIECSINKVFATEALQSICDEGVQIHGGYGYIQEYKIERIYRDARINRIFEGTNEINRLLIPGMLLKKAMKGELSLFESMRQLEKELMNPMTSPQSASLLDQLNVLLDQSKRLLLYIGGLAVQTYGEQLEEQQEVLAGFADLMIDLYAMESCLARTSKRYRQSGEEAALLAVQMTQLFMEQTFEKQPIIARKLLTTMSDGDERRMHLSILKKLTKFQPGHHVGLGREIAKRVIEQKGYSV